MSKVKETDFQHNYEKGLSAGRSFLNIRMSE